MLRIPWTENVWNDRIVREIEAKTTHLELKMIVDIFGIERENTVKGFWHYIFEYIENKRESRKEWVTSKSFEAIRQNR